MKFELPSIKKIFIPGKDFVIVEADVAGADARVAAWECGGQFKSDFTGGRKIHVETMQAFFPDLYKLDPKHEPQYTKCKNMAFGTIYGGRPRGISAAAALPERQVSMFQEWFIRKYPEIREWHRRIELELATKRSVSNAFGYSIRYFDRVETLLPEALAWIPQSTVAVGCQRGQLILKREFPWVKQLLQVHDSIVFKLRERDYHHLPRIRDRLNQISAPYPDPLFFQWEFKSSPVSWGDCTTVDWGNL